MVVNASDNYISSILRGPYNLMFFFFILLVFLTNVKSAPPTLDSVTVFPLIRDGSQIGGAF